MQEKILIVGPSWIGDMIMAQSLFKTLKERRHDVIIDVLAPAWTMPILARMPEVNKGIEFPVGHGQLAWKTRKSFGQKLQSENYTQAIVLPNSLKSSLVPWMSKIPKRTGWRGELRFGFLNDIRVLDKRRYPLMIERFVALAFPRGATLPSRLPEPALAVDPTAREKTLARLGLSTERDVLVLCPGAEYGPAKRWPPEHFAEVANWHLNSGGQVWVMGSKKDQVFAEAIQKQAPDALSLCGATALAEAIDLMSLAKAVVSNDSGLMHVAAALNLPMAAIYGSSAPTFTPPLSSQAEVLSLQLSCSPCFKRDCPLGHTNCLKHLDGQRVIDALKVKLSN